MKLKNAFVHGCYFNDNRDYRAVICEQEEDGTPRLKYFVNPTKRVWVTKKQLRTHQDLKEWEYLKNLDMYTVTDKNANDILSRAIYGYAGRNSSLFSLNRSPYTYGTDITMLSLIKRAYNKQTSINPMELNVGKLDIETSVLQDRRIINICYVDGKTKTVYMAVARWKFDEPTQRVHVVTEEQIATETDKILREKFTKLKPKVKSKVNLNYKFVVKLCDTEEEIIRWTFARLHECKPMFCGIWNLSFDIEYIIMRLQVLGIKPEDVFCHPDVKAEFRWFMYKPDKSEVEHHTDAWHQVECSGYTKFVDDMCMYSRLRKVYGREISYKLDIIANKILGIKKLEIIPGATHRKLQTTRFFHYSVYNGLDGILLDLLEQSNDDTASMLGLLENTPVGDFSKQTVMLKNTFFDYCLENGMVSGSTSGKNVFKHSELLGPKLGGAVLPPLLAKDTGVAILDDCDFKTRLNMYVADIDVTGMYPHFIITFGISRETTISDIIAVEHFTREDILAFFSNARSLEENSVMLASEYLGLASYGDITQALEKYK